MESDKNKKFLRALIRTQQRDERIVISVTGQNTRYIRALQTQCPRLSSVKLSKVKKEETTEWTEELLDLEKKIS